MKKVVDIEWTESYYEEAVARDSRATQKKHRNKISIFERRLGWISKV